MRRREVNPDLFLLFEIECEMMPLILDPVFKKYLLYVSRVVLHLFEGGIHLLCKRHDPVLFGGLRRGQVESPKKQQEDREES